jgi:hypothetical protein
MADSTERLGELLVRVGAITPEQVREILDYQKEHPGQLFGQIAIELGFITEEMLQRYL